MERKGPHSRQTRGCHGFPRLYLTILSFFLLMVLFVFALGMGVYHATLISSRAEFEERAEGSLSALWGHIDASLITAYETGRTLLDNFYIQEHLGPYNTRDAARRLALFKIPQVINESKRLLDSADEIFLYVDAGKVYNSEGISDFEPFFSSIYQYENHPAPFWASRLRDSAALSVLRPERVFKRFSGVSRTVAPIVSSDYINGWRAVSVVNLNIDDYRRTLDAGFLYEYSYAVFTGQNEVAFSNMGEPRLEAVAASEYGTRRNEYVEIEGESFLHIVMRGSSGWRIKALIPESEYLSINNDLLRLIFAICATLTLLGLLLSFVFAYLLYSPMRNIQRIIRDVSPAPYLPDSLRGIELEAANLIRNYQSAQDNEYAEGYVALQSYLLHGLNGHNLRLLTEVLSNGRFSNANYVVMAVSVEFLEIFHEQSDVSRDIMRHSLLLLVEINFPAPLFFMEFGDSMQAAVINLPEDGLPSIERGIQKLLGILEHDMLYMRCCFGVSGVSDQIGDLRRLFDEARTAVEYGMMIGKQPVVYASNLPIHDAYSYSFAQEQELIRYLKTADMKNLQKYTMEIILNNQKAAVSWRGIRNLIIAMLGTAQRLFKNQIEVGLDTPHALKSPMASYHMMLDQFQRMMIKSGDARDPSNVAIDYIRRYIEQHYADNLSLSELAEKAGYNAKYISRLFKNYIGYNLSDYVSYARVMKAKELLKDFSLTITEIQNRVGIPSNTTFTRVFKKFEGISPGRYRQLEQIVLSESEEHDIN